jgi:hypothetical protein
MSCRANSWREGVGTGKWPGQLIPRGSKMSNLDGKKLIFLCSEVFTKGKGKAVPLQAWSGLEGSRKLR